MIQTRQHRVSWILSHVALGMPPPRQPRTMREIQTLGAKYNIKADDASFATLLRRCAAGQHS